MLKEILSKKDLTIKLILLSSIIIFYAFGFYHLGKFETVDEHFWKFDRVPQYWHALKDQDWRKTHINDKPGITVGIISGLGLIYDHHPETLRVRDPKITQDEVLTVYDSTRTEGLNIALRAPVLLFNGILLLYFYWVIKKFSGSKKLGALSVLLLATSPVLIGISQIINPDAMLWSFSAAAIFSYLALFRTKEKKFILLVILFTGLALLSKYTANILFPIYLILLYSYYFFENNKFTEIKESKKYFLKKIVTLFIIYGGSLVIFSLLMPSVFVRFRHLGEGTYNFPGFQAVLLPMLTIIAITVLDVLINQAWLMRKIGKFIYQKKDWIIKISSALLLFIILFSLVNVWTNQTMVPLDKMRNENYFAKDFTFGGLVESDNSLIKTYKIFLAEIYPFLFSLNTLAMLIIIIFLAFLLFKKQKKYQLEIFFVTIFPIFYFIAMMQSGVLANIRYSIMLYPLFFFFAALASLYLLENIKFFRNIKFIALAILFALIGIITLFSSKPFYFNYTTWMLPKKFMIADAWGYGEYEAAEYLNSLPNAENLKIWSDRSAICQFLKGDCIRDYKIDLSLVTPDYFVISRRGEIRHKFEWEKPELASMSNLEYYEKPAVWRLNILGREDNFVKIIKVRE